MKKKFMIVIASLVVIFIAMMAFAPADLGRVTYNSAIAVESKIYGLKENQIDIGEMTMSYYQNDWDDSRETILMLHGFSADKVVWLRFAQHFSDDFNLLIPDMAGHGKTGFDENWNYSATAQAQRLNRLTDLLNIKKLHIIGNSMGGLISAHFAKNHADKTITATLVDPSGVRSKVPSDMEKLLLQGKNPFQIKSREEFDKFYAMTMASPPWLPDFMFDFFAQRYQNQRDQLKHIFEDFGEDELLDKHLAEIHVPVLLMWGAKDRLLHVSSVEGWVNGIKNIKVKVWPDIGHMPMVEIPSESAEVYREFLTQVK